MQGTFEIQGQKFRTGSTRRYVIVSNVPKSDRLHVVKRSDSLAVVLTEATRLRRDGWQVAGIVDTTTGDEVAAACVVCGRPAAYRLTDPTDATVSPIGTAYCGPCTASTAAGFAPIH